jgi:hypothetical protein
MTLFDSNNFYAAECWRQQYSTVLWLPVHSEITVSKWGVPHPLEGGFVASIGEASGQKADYRLPLEDGREVHVRDYGDHYTLHLDQVSAVRNPLGHLLTDAPHWIIWGAIGAIGAAIVLGIIFSGNRKQQ